MKLDKPIPADRLRRDFDRIAHLPGEGSWDHNSHYHRFLLGRLPRTIGRRSDEHGGHGLTTSRPAGGAGSRAAHCCEEMCGSWRGCSLRRP